MKRVFYSGFSVCLIVILAVAIRRPQNNLIPARMILYTLVWVLILCGIRALLSALEKKISQKNPDMEKLSRTGLFCYIVFYGIALYIVSLILRSYPITDYGYIYHTAYDLATGQAVEDWTYFSMWTNNLAPLTILTFCMKLGVLLKLPDPYYFVLALNVLQMMAVMAGIYYLAGQIGERSLSRQWFAVLVFTLWTPVWASTNAFYSDQLSFGGSIIAIALTLYGICLKGRKKWLVVAGAGLIWGVGIAAKATCAIAAVALVITVILAGRKGRKVWRELLLLGVMTLLTVGLFSVSSGRYPSREDEYRLKTPVEYWIAMGLMGDGTYADNAYLIQECNYSQNVDERRDFCRRMIRENWRNLFRGEHLADKVSVIFGEGSISPTSHMYPYEESLLWHWVYWDGDYYWKYACLSTGFFFAVLFIILIGTLCRIFAAGKDREKDLTFLIYLTIFGLFLFLMLWEAQNKQLYNHISWLTLAVVCGLESMGEYAIMITAKVKGSRQAGDASGLQGKRGRVHAGE